MDTWNHWKKAFYTWEDTTARFTEELLKSPFVLQPAGKMLSAAMRAKAEGDRRTAMWWSGLGLPTRADQERMMHAINQLHSRIHDLEEQLAAQTDVIQAGADNTASGTSTTQVK